MGTAILLQNSNFCTAFRAYKYTQKKLEHAVQQFANMHTHKQDS